MNHYIQRINAFLARRDARDNSEGADLLRSAAIEIGRLERSAERVWLRQQAFFHALGGATTTIEGLRIAERLRADGFVATPAELAEGVVEDAKAVAERALAVFDAWEAEHRRPERDCEGAVRP